MTNYGTLQPGKKETLKGGIVEFLEKLENKIGMVHLIDNDGTLYKDITSMHVPFGQGDINFEEVIPALKEKANYTGEWWIVDLVFNSNAWNLLAECREYLMKMDEKYGD
jgi:sugar phosphate isomerase/epimerase